MSDDTTSGSTASDGTFNYPVPKPRWMIVCPDCRVGFETGDPNIPAHLGFNARTVMCKSCGSSAFPWIRKLRPGETAPREAPPRSAVVAKKEPDVKKMIQQEHDENRIILKMWGDKEPPFKL